MPSGGSGMKGHRLLGLGYLAPYVIGVIVGLALMAIVRPAVLADTIRLLAGAVRSGVSREGSAARPEDREPAEPVAAAAS